MTGSNAKVSIYFGSQTGTAECFAFELDEQAKERGIQTNVVDLEEFKPDVFVTHQVVIMLMATTGEGDPTDNAFNFHNWASNGATPSDSLRDISFAVFGLGDRSYVNFNKMGEETDGNLERLGGKRFCPRGVGDDSEDIVADFEKWKETLWPLLVDVVSGVDGSGAQKGLHPEDPKGGYPSSKDKRWGRSKDAVVATGQTLESVEAEAVPVMKMAANAADLPIEVPGKPADVLARFFFEAKRGRVSKIEELRQYPEPDEGLMTAHVELKVSCGYDAAGTLEILPENDPEDIQGLLPLLGIATAVKPGDIGDLDCCITFVPSVDSGSDNFRKPFPTPCSLRDALTKYCDLRTAPTRQMLIAFRSHLDAGPRERVARLLNDASAYKIIHDEWLGWTQEEFWSALGVDHLDLGLFLLHCPKQRARPYTIASSPCATPDEIHVCVSLTSRAAAPLDGAVAALKAKGVFPADRVAPVRKKRWFGLASQWMCSRLRPGDSVLVQVRPSALRLPEADVPLVMVCSGAGVAPFRAFWSELQATTAVVPPTDSFSWDLAPPTDNSSWSQSGLVNGCRNGLLSRTASRALYFGCRHPERDWIYRAEMTTFHNTPNTTLNTAFSRVGEEGVYDNSGCCGEYVQDKLKASIEDLRMWLSEKGVLYICGSTPMGQGVLDALAGILEGGADEVAQLRKEGRICAEFWGAPAKIDTELAAVVAPELAAEANGKSIEDLSKALLEAVKNGNRSEVERLLAEGADANYQAGSRKYTRIGLRQEVGETGLHWAALRGDDHIANCLLAAKAETDLRDQDGKSALHIASFNGVHDVSKTLLAAKCDANAHDLRGNTALHWVMLAGGSMRMIKLLLANGARAAHTNENGETAVDLAEDMGNEVVADLLRSAGD